MSSGLLLALVAVTALPAPCPAAGGGLAQPASRPGIHRKGVGAGSRPVLPAIRPRPLPKLTRVSEAEIGTLSFEALEQELVYVDGHLVGKGMMAYLRFPARRLLVTFAGPKGRLRIPVRVRAGRNISVVREWSSGKLQLARLAGDTRAELRRYGQRRPQRTVVAPGRVCPGGGVVGCFALGPGELLYLGPPGKDGPARAVLPTRAALRRGKVIRGGPNDALLTIHSFPPGVLLVDGKLVTITPVAGLALRPGKRRLTVVSRRLGAKWTAVLPFRPKERRRVAVTLLHEGRGNIETRTRSPARIFVDGRFKGWSPNPYLPTRPGSRLLRLEWPDGTRVRRWARVRVGESTAIREDR